MYTLFKNLNSICFGDIHLMSKKKRNDDYKNSLLCVYKIQRKEIML